MNLLTSALNYKKNGLSVISTDSAKTSIFSWKPYQSQIASDEQLQQMFNHVKAKGIAVICGAVSGNLEVIDVDCKYGVKWEDYADKIVSENPQLYARLKIVRTRSNGYHIYYRCETIQGNQKLAERPATDDEKFINPNVKQFVLIETRGEAGYVIAPPSDGYEPLDKNDIPVISVDERDLLFSIARSFNQIIENVKQPNLPSSNSGLTVFDDYNMRGDIIALLEKHGWRIVKEDADKYSLIRPGQTSSATSAVLFKQNRIFYPHTTSTSFQNKGYNPFAVYTHLECKDDYKKAAKILSETYGTKLPDGWFWSKSDKGKVTISRYKLAQWLYEQNFMIYFPNNKSNAWRIIRQKDEKKLSEVFTENIKKFIKTELENHGHLDVLEQLMKETTSILNDSFFEYINQAKINLLKDDENTCYFPFTNGVVKITDTDVTLIANYNKIQGHIWESQITDFDIEINRDIDSDHIYFSQFLYRICGDDKERLFYAMTLIGYILHSYKDPSRPYAPILAEETEDETKGGGTGKGLFFQAIGKLIPVVRIDGKNFRPDKTFAFQRVQLGTKLVIIEDCPKNVDFERYYPTITEGITIEKKNQDELFLNFADSPKIAFTTNYTINNNSEHSRRRQRVLEFASYFSSKHTPKDEFGHTFFDDWDHDEWVKFYNFMFECVRMYLKNGILMVDNSDKLKRKQIKMQFGEDFLDYYDDIESDKSYGLSQEWKSFLVRYELEKKDYSLKRFKKGLQVASEILGFDYKEEKIRQNNNLLEFRIAKISNKYADL